jgi:hypothetical protein
MSAIRFSTSLLFLAALWLAPTVARGESGDCTITRPHGLKEPGVKNDKGKCCSAFYADDCVPPTPGQRAVFYSSSKR